MPQVQLDLSKEENRIVRHYQAEKNLDKKEAIKSIIRKFGKLDKR